MEDEIKIFQEHHNYPPNTLGYHYAFCILLFGADSPATKFIKGKIDNSPNGASEMCIADERQVVRLLTTLHFESLKDN